MEVHLLHHHRHPSCSLRTKWFEHNVFPLSYVRRIGCTSTVHWNEVHSEGLSLAMFLLRRRDGWTNCSLILLYLMMVLSCRRCQSCRGTCYVLFETLVRMVAVSVCRWWLQWRMQSSWWVMNVRRFLRWVMMFELCSCDANCKEMQTNRPIPDNDLWRMMVWMIWMVVAIFLQQQTSAWVGGRRQWGGRKTSTACCCVAEHIMQNAVNTLRSFQRFIDKMHFPDTHHQAS